jgi:hypothetical protein
VHSFVYVNKWVSWARNELTSFWFIDSFASQNTIQSSLNMKTDKLVLVGEEKWTICKSIKAWMSENRKDNTFDGPEKRNTHIYIYSCQGIVYCNEVLSLSLSLFRRRRQRWNKHRVKNDALSNRKKKWEERKTIHKILCIIVRRVVPLLHLNILLLLLFYYHSMRRQSTLHRILATRSLKTTLYSFWLL